MALWATVYSSTLSRVSALVGFFLVVPLLNLQATLVSANIGFTFANWIVTRVLQILDLIRRGFVFLAGLYVSSVLGLCRFFLLFVPGRPDLSAAAERVVNVILYGLFGFFLINWMLGPIFLFAYQSQTQVVVDVATCMPYPIVHPFILAGNRFVNLFNAVRIPFNILTDILCRFAASLVEELTNLVVRGGYIILRFLADPDGSTESCQIPGPGSLTEPLCPDISDPYSYAAMETCVVQDLSCWGVDVVQFIFEKVLANFLRIFIPPLGTAQDPVTSALNVIEAFFYTLLSAFEMRIELLFVPAQISSPYLGCLNNIVSANTSPDVAFNVLTDRQNCPKARFLAGSYYLFRVIIGTGFDIVQFVLVDFISPLIGDYLGVDIGSVLRDLLLIAREIYDKITRFDELVEALFDLFIIPFNLRILENLRLIRGIIDQIRAFIDDPLGWFYKLPGQLATIPNALLSRILGLASAIDTVRNALARTDAAVRSLYNIVNSLGGGLFRHMLMEGDKQEWPLHPTQNVIVAFQTSIPGTSVETARDLYYLAAMYNTSLSIPCWVSPGVVETLESKHEWTPNLDGILNAGMPGVIPTDEQLDMLHYMKARDECVPIDEVTPYDHIRLVAPQIPRDSNCYDVLTRGVLEHSLNGEILEEGSWYGKDYAVCTLLYTNAWLAVDEMDDDDDHSPEEVIEAMVRLADDPKWIEKVDLLATESMKAVVRVGRTIQPMLDFVAEDHSHFVQHVHRERGEHHAAAKDLHNVHSHLTRKRDPVKSFPLTPRSFLRPIKTAPTKYTVNLSRFTRRHMARGRVLLQATVPRDFNFNDLVLKAVTPLRLLFSFILDALGIVFRNIGFEAFADILEGGTQFMLNFEFESSAQFVLDLWLGYLETVTDQFECEYNVRTNPNGAWSCACFFCGQIPELPLIPEGPPVLNWGTPCLSSNGTLADPGTCQYSNPLPNTGFIVTDLVQLTTDFPVVTGSPCAEYANCQSIGFVDAYSGLMWKIGLVSETSTVNLIGLLRSSALSTFTRLVCNTWGTASYPLLVLLQQGDLGDRLIATTGSNDAPYLAGVLGSFPQPVPKSDFHRSCATLYFSASLVPGLLAIATVTASAVYMFVFGRVFYFAISTGSVVVAWPSEVFNAYRSLENSRVIERTKYVEVDDVVTPVSLENA